MTANSHTWFNTPFWAGLALLLGGQFGTWPIKNRHTARAVYWSSAFAGSALLGLATIRAGWELQLVRRRRAW
jgi:hypothetical protein